MSRKELSIRLRYSEIDQIGTLRSVDEVMGFLRAKMVIADEGRAMSAKILEEKKQTKLEAKRFSKRNKGLTPKGRKIRPGSLADQATKFRNKLLKNKTESEKLFEEILKSAKIKYECQKIFFAGESFFIVDFFLTSSRCVVEIDGGYHEGDIQKIKDLNRTSTLRRTCDVREVIRFTNEEILSPENCLDTLQKIINKTLAI